MPSIDDEERLIQTNDSAPIRDNIPVDNKLDIDKLSYYNKANNTNELFPVAFNKSQPPSYEEIINAYLTTSISLSPIFKQSKLAVENQYPNRDLTPLSQEDKIDYIAGNPWILDNDKAIRKITSSSVRADIYDFEKENEYELKQREIISRADTPTAILAGVGMGFIDPVSWFPVGNIYKSARAAWGVGKSALSVGGATAGSISLQEMILQQDQYNREFNESVANVLAGATIGSILGGGVGYLSNKTRPAGIDDLIANNKSILNGDDRKLFIKDGEITMTVNGYDKSILEAQSAGAAVNTQKVDFNSYEYAEKLRQDNSLYNVPKYIDSFMKQTPFFRLIQSPFGWYRKFAADNLANASILNKHLEGESSGTSIELGVSAWLNKMLDTQTKLDGAYQAYTGITSGYAKNIRAWYAAKNTEKMSREQFNTEVYNAAINGDIHAIPEVQNAISVIRPFFEELKDEAVKLKLLPENVGVTTAISYMMRVYNRELIERNRFLIQDAGIVSEPFQNKVEKYLRNTQIEIQNIIDDYNIFDAQLKKQEELVSSYTEKDVEVLNLNIEFLENKIKSKDSNKKETIKDLNEALNQKKNILDLAELRAKKFQDFNPNLFDSEGNLYEIIGKNLDPNDFKYKVLITAHADSIIDNILGLGTEVLNNRFNIGIRAPSSGGKPLNNRVFKISDTEIAEYLEKDMGRIIQQYGRNMGFAVEVSKYAQRIGVPESESISSYFSKMATKELNELIRLNPKDVHKLNSQFFKNQEDMNNSLLAIQGFYGQPQGTWNQGVARILRGIKQWQGMRLLGMISSYVPVDLGLSTFQHGMPAWYRDGIEPLIKSGSIKGFTKNQANDIGLALETETGRIFQSMVTGTEVSHNKNKYEVFMEKAARGYGNLNLANQIEDLTTGINANIIKAEIVRSMIKWKEGKLSKNEMRQLAVSRIDKEYYSTIYDQLEKTGSLEPVKGSYYMNLHLWDKTDDAVMAASQVQQGIQLMVDQSSMRTPYVGDRPLVTRTTSGSALLLFKNFLWASQNKLLFNSIIQRRDAAAIQGVSQILVMGALAYVIRQTAYGRPIEQDRVIFEAIDNSGILSMLVEPSVSLLKFFGFGPAQDSSRYYGRSDWSLLLGPTFSIIEDGTILARVTNGFFNWENVNEKDIQKTFRLLPFSNLPPVNPVVNYVTKNVAESFDLKTIEEMNKERGE